MVFVKADRKQPASGPNKGKAVATAVLAFAAVAIVATTTKYTGAWGSWEAGGFLHNAAATQMSGKIAAVQQVDALNDVRDKIAQLKGTYENTPAGNEKSLLGDRLMSLKNKIGPMLAEAKAAMKAEHDSHTHINELSAAATSQAMATTPDAVMSVNAAAMEGDGNMSFSTAELMTHGRDSKGNTYDVVGKPWAPPPSWNSSSEPATIAAAVAVHVTAAPVDVNLDEATSKIAEAPVPALEEVVDEETPPVSMEAVTAENRMASLGVLIDHKIAVAAAVQARDHVRNAFRGDAQLAMTVKVAVVIPEGDEDCNGDCRRAKWAIAVAQRDVLADIAKLPGADQPGQAADLPILEEAPVSGTNPSPAPLTPLSVAMPDFLAAAPQDGVADSAATTAPTQSWEFEDSLTDPMQDQLGIQRRFGAGGKLGNFEVQMAESSKDRAISTLTNALRSAGSVPTFGPSVSSGLRPAPRAVPARGGTASLTATPSFEQLTFDASDITGVPAAAGAAVPSFLPLTAAGEEKWEHVAAGLGADVPNMVEDEKKQFPRTAGDAPPGGAPAPQVPPPWKGPSPWQDSPWQTPER